MHVSKYDTERELKEKCQACPHGPKLNWWKKACEKCLKKVIHEAVLADIGANRNENLR